MILKFMNRIFLLLFSVLLNFSYSQEEVLVDGVFAIVGGHVIFHSDIDSQVLQYYSQGISVDDELELREIAIK